MIQILPYLTIIFFLILLLISYSIFTLFLIYSSLKGCFYVGTNKKLIKKILKNANLKKNKIFYDLGCGDGRVVIEAVKDHQVIGVGVDVNPILLKLAKLKARINRLNNKKIQFIRQDIRFMNFLNADYVYLFLMPKLIEEIKPNLSQLKKGAIIISHGFKIENWDNLLIRKINDRPFSTFYYKIK